MSRALRRAEPWVPGVALSAAIAAGFAARATMDRSGGSGASWDLAAKTAAVKSIVAIGAVLHLTCMTHVIAMATTSVGTRGPFRTPPRWLRGQWMGGWKASRPRSRLPWLAPRGSFRRVIALSNRPSPNPHPACRRRPGPRGCRGRSRSDADTMMTITEWSDHPLLAASFSVAARAEGWDAPRHPFRSDPNSCSSALCGW